MVNNELVQMNIKTRQNTGREDQFSAATRGKMGYALKLLCEAYFPEIPHTEAVFKALETHAKSSPENRAKWAEVATKVSESEF